MESSRRPAAEKSILSSGARMSAAQKKSVAVLYFETRAAPKRTNIPAMELPKILLRSFRRSGESKSFRGLKCSEIVPEDVRARILLAGMLAHQKQHMDAAGRLLQTAVALRPGDFNILFNAARASCYERFAYAALILGGKLCRRLAVPPCRGPHRTARFSLA
jgi:hypothetical protein